jgi:organic hydroperoxide reductase OsmC/OhrA
MPKAMGGTGKGENPEQLFAMGYSGMQAALLTSYCITDNFDT